jgi:hypothetical protein
MHDERVVALHDVWRPAVALEEVLELLPADAAEQRGIGDLVAVEMKDRQDGAVADGVEELVGVPRRGERTGLRFAVADDDADEQVRVVKRGAERVRNAVTELSSLMDRSGRLRRAVAADPAGEAEVLEEQPQAVEILRLVRVDLGVRPFEVDRREHARRAVTGAGEEDRVEIVLLD